MNNKKSKSIYNLPKQFGKKIDYTTKKTKPTYINKIFVKNNEINTKQLLINEMNENPKLYFKI